MIKKVILFVAVLIALPALAPSAAASEPEPEDITLQAGPDLPWTDTIAVISDAGRIVVAEKGDATVLTVRGSGSDPDYYYHYSLEPRRDTVTAPSSKLGIDIPFGGNIRKSAASMRFLKNLYVGCNMPVGPGSQLKAGWEIGIGEVIGYGYTPNNGKTVLSAGFGFAYRTLSAAHGLLFAKDNGTLTLSTRPQDASHPSASIQFWQLQFPFLITQTIYRDLGFNFGVILNLNVSAKARSSYRVDELNLKTSVDNLHQRFLTPDLFATIGLRDDIGAYIKFSPMNAMCRYRGTRMSMLSVGVNLAF